MTKQLRATFAAMLVASSVPVLAQTTTTTTTKKSPDAVTTTTTTKTRTKGSARTAKRKAAVPRETAAEREIRELRQEMQAQIDGLKQQLADRDAKLTTAQAAIQTAQDQAAAASTQAQTIQTQLQQNTETLTGLQSNVADLQVVNAGLTQTVINNKTELTEQIESPTAIHYKGVTIQPVAFFALEGVWRQKSVNSDVNTPFNSIPYNGANEAHVGEFQFSGRQSRVGALFTGNAGRFALSGYVEADFLSAGTTSNNNQSNSFTLRQRQIWGQATTKKGFQLTGGQMWSLVTETGRGTEPRTEKLPNSVDAQYVVGFNWARQPAVRISQRFGELTPSGGHALTLAMSLEQAQITGLTVANGPNNYFYSGAGQNGGLYNAFNGTPNNNVAPDVFAKATLDVPHAHFEVGGVARFFRERYYPAVVTAGTGAGNAVPGALPRNNTVLAGGAFGNARVSVSKYLDLAASVMGGDGVGRYGTSQLADATVKPTGVFEPVRNYHALFSIESHPTKNLDVYGYAGGEYAQRTVYTTGVAATPFTGYAPINLSLSGCNTETYPAPTAPTVGSGGQITPAAGCGAQTRAIYEGLFGFTYRLYSSPKFGRLQYQANYQYITKQSWAGVRSGTYGSTTTPPTFGEVKASDPMVLTGLRYYIP